jgi:hypothetical protein
MKLLDPTRPDDPRFDPHGEQGRRVLAAAKTRATRGRRGAERRRGGGAASSRRGRLAAGGLVVVACALAALFFLPAGGPPDARAALAESLRHMREIDSGIVVMTIAGDRNEVRFDGADMEWTSSSGVWKRVGRQDIVRLAQRAPDLTTRELADGFHHTATATAGEVFDAMPIAAGRAQGGAWRRPVPLEVTVRDGYVRRVRTGDEITEYLSLGEPQSIERPVT